MHHNFLKGHRCAWLAEARRYEKLFADDP